MPLCKLRKVCKRGEVGLGSWWLGVTGYEGVREVVVGWMAAKNRKHTQVGVFFTL